MNETLRRLHRDRSGFTLVELLIALAVAGVIGTSIYFVYRGQTRVFFIQETVAQTQSELRFAMETIKSDVKRAGYLAPISTTNDNFWCGSRPSQPITAIFAQASNGFVHNSSENINITPDSLRVLGSFSANNTLYTEGVSGNVITVSADAIYSPGFPKSQADFDRVFAPGRLLNILDAANRYQIQSITAQSYGSRTITVSTINRSTIQGCGPTGIGQGLLENPLEYVRYRIIDTSSTTNPALCDNSPALVGRSTLVRENLGPDGTTVLDTVHVADYIVDLRAWFMVDTATLGTQPSIADDLNPYDFVGNQTTDYVAANPQNARSVGVFLAARTPAEDPTFPFRQRQTADGVGVGAMGPLISFNIDSDRAASCRVRALSTEIQLRNFNLSSRL